MRDADWVEAPQADVRFAAELRMFLAPRHRAGVVGVACDGVSSLGHVIESLGVPLPETGALAVNGRWAVPRYRLAAGDVADVRAVRRPQIVSSPRFVLDVHLGTLARRLRVLGVDSAYTNDADDDALIEQANASRRVLLTQDRGLLCRRSLWLGAYVRGSRPDDQLADVLDRFAPALAPWTRCTGCNGLLAPVRKADVEPELQPGTRRTYQAFSRCRDCGKVYWRGAHSRRLQRVIDSAFGAVAASRERDALPWQWCLPPGYRGGLDPDPERMLRRGDPWLRVEPAQPSYLVFVVHRFGAAVYQDTPSRASSFVIAVCLECHELLAVGRRQFRPVGRAEDRALAVNDVVDRQDNYLAVGLEADSPDRDGGQQAQARVERQYLEPCMIGRVPRHSMLRS
jgi:uncharacterized protein with PIN domain